MKLVTLCKFVHIHRSSWITVASKHKGTVVKAYDSLCASQDQPSAKLIHNTSSAPHAAHQDDACTEGNGWQRLWTNANATSTALGVDPSGTITDVGSSHHLLGAEDNVTFSLIMITLLYQHAIMISNKH